MTYIGDGQTHLDSLGALLSAADTELIDTRARLAAATAQNSADTATILTLRNRITELEQLIANPPPGPVDPPPVDPPTDGRALLSWAPPTLTNPKTLDLSNPATLATIAAADGKIKLAAGVDYLVKLPTAGAFRNKRGLWFEGGNNVVIVGGEVDVLDGYNDPGTGPGVPADHMVRRAAYFLSQTGRVHLEGVRFISSTRGNLSEGLNISAGASPRVTVQNVDLQSPLVGTKAANHADALQTWNGPRWLGVDGLEADCGYQGMFLNPHDTGTGPVDDLWVLRNVELRGSALAKYILWVTSPPAKVVTDRVYTSGGLGNWDAAADWPDVKHGVRAPADVLTGPRSAGPGYTTPGYRTA